MTGEEREKWINRNQYYYKTLVNLLKYSIPEGASILEIGCGTGFLLEKLNPKIGVGIDISTEFISYAKANRSKYTFYEADAERFRLDQTFDFILLSDTIGSFMDVQAVFAQIQNVCTNDTRIIVTSTNSLWNPLLNFAEKIGLKMPQKRQNWLDTNDIINLFNLESFENIEKSRRILLPINIPILSFLLNKYLCNLPIFNYLGLVNILIARSSKNIEKLNNELSVSVIIPARNEKGNIEDLVKRTPQMGKHTEIIFIEGNSTDDTWAEVQRIGEKYKDKLDLKWAQQPGKGKGDAVRKGFGMATCDVLMILDADMTVPPEELPKFFNAIAAGKGEYINGTRLVYPMEQEAMRFLNLLGNKFFSLAFSWLLGQKLKDTLCGTKVLTRENYLKIAANRSYFGEFDPFGDFDLIFGASKLNLKFIEVPIRYKARSYGETNISRFKHGLILLKMTVFALNKIKFR
jgi:SAM-dependent methyltransferase